MQLAQSDTHSVPPRPQGGSTSELNVAQGNRSSLSENVCAACAKIPPLWGLDQFVAVNPFWGFRARRFESALRELSTIASESALPPKTYFAEKVAKGELDAGRIARALTHLKARGVIQSEVSPDSVITTVLDPKNSEKHSARSLLHLIDTAQGTNHAELTHHELTKFLALYFDRGQAALPSTLNQMPLFAAWCEFASIDLSLDIAGMRGARAFFKDISPHHELEVIEKLATALSVEGSDLELILSCELFSCRGWAAYLQHLDFEDNKSGESKNRVQTLLAMRCAYTLFALERFAPNELQVHLHKWLSELRQIGSYDAWLAALACQTATELTFSDHLRNSFLLRSIEADASVAGHARPKLQAMFCIDVRSEGLRRNLESVSPDIETYGFAGFFGLSFSFSEVAANRPSDQYPVLLQRKFTVTEVVDPRKTDSIPAQDRARHALSLFIRILRQSVCSGFSYVESLGLFYGLKMLKHTWTTKAPTPLKGVSSKPTTLLIELSLQEKVAAARAILKNSGLRAPFAPVVLLCGHRGCVTNNPYAAGLDCGACGGHGGESNARVAAQLLNDPEVRIELQSLGIEIEGDTRFIPAVHITTTETIELLDHEGLLGAHERIELQNWIDLACQRSRAQLVLALGGVNVNKPLAAQMNGRSADWSELRPEWALARNAGFIAARRSRTRGVELGNRCFLHEYDSASDPDSSILELIMTAPMVVASWINLQYYGSTVMPHTFGAGNKTIHNVVGQLGTVLGNGGDLGIGLPIQSVHTGDAPFHEPLRLHVIIEAPPEKIEAVIAKHTLLQDLIDNGWIYLSCLARDSSILRVRVGAGNWM